MSSEKVVREKPIPEFKKKVVKELIDKISSSRTVLIASSRGLPGPQFHEIKKKLRAKAEMKVAKKSSILKAIDGIDKGSIKNLKEQIQADIVLMFSDADAFELSGILSANQSPRKAKAGDIAPYDIEIEAGMTELVPGPAISELGAVGLKVKVSDGKLEIMQNAVVVKEGEEIKENVASVLGKLDVTPMKVGFIPLAAYDSQDDKMYVDIIIDQEGTLEAMREMIGKALGFAVNVSYPAKETISYFIAKASAEEKALAALTPKEEKKETPSEEVKEETEGEKTEEKEEVSEEKKEEAAEEKKEESCEEDETQEPEENS